MTVSKSSFSGYIEALGELLEKYDDVLALECRKFHQTNELPKSERRISVGMAEQDMVLNAAGLALCGHRIYLVAPDSPLIVARSYEQIRAAVAVPNLKVVLSSVQDGYAFNQDGAARQMYEDLALMRALPNMAVLAPSDHNSARALTASLMRHDGPAYIRLSYSDDTGIHCADDADFYVGGARLLTEGEGVTICANGMMVGEALKASAILAQQGISAEIIDCYSIKPFPEQMLLASVRRTGCCVTAEKHVRTAGLYGAVAECLAANYPVPIRSIAIEDEFGQSGTSDELQEYYGLTYREIVHNVVQVWAMRRR